ncbi:acyltransferase [Sphingobium sp. CR2-8]|uniref:acyltransferase family protein n=1 Tax=Sphingobium sp. CR2-8 TaxID=1306534 RepID=UPI002DBD52A7|nr:acyltransferase [Sphingobium sp. CR2-8]MEC3911272.1 acyltransferase [Sphingobium sp. CR2-8]
MIDESVPQPTKSVRMQSIIFARGVAALFVVFHHAGRMAAQERFFGEEAFRGVYDRFTGVNYFFVLSGFFIGWLSWKNIGETGQVGRFFAKRMARIYPVYWLVLIPHIILYLLIPSAGKPWQRDPINILLSFFLLPYVDPPIYGVAWTLVQELLFCIVMAIVIAIGPRGIWLLALWGLTVAIAQFTHLPHVYPATVLLNGANFQFLLGIATSRLLVRWLPDKPHLWAFAGATIYILFIFMGGAVSLHPFLDQTIYGVSTCILLIGLVGMEKRRPIAFPPVLLAFGAASYSIYLVHPVFLSVGTNISSRILKGTGISTELVILMLIIMATAVAMIFDRLVEAPVTKIISPVLARWLERPFVIWRRKNQLSQI